MTAQSLELANPEENYVANRSAACLGGVCKLF